jgi:hypothetical protein
MADILNPYKTPYLGAGAWRDLKPGLPWTNQSHSDDSFDLDVPITEQLTEQRNSERFVVFHFAGHGADWNQAPAHSDWIQDLVYIQACMAALNIVEAKPQMEGQNKRFLRIGRAHQQSQTTPANYDDIAAAIRKSREMLQWEDDWDGEGSPAYLEATWQRATNLLRTSVLELWDTQRKLAPTPRVTPGPNGSIDLYWRADNYKLLINIPVDSNEMADYYGQNRHGEIIEGTLDTMTSAMWLLVWLTK